MASPSLKMLGRIGVLMGGCSSEREISLRSGQGVYQSLSSGGLDAVAIDITSDQKAQVIDLIQREKIDVAFIALHGRLGEDGQIQAILEQLKIPYTGSGIESSRMAFNKILTQQALRTHGLPVADFYVLQRDRPDSLEKVLSKLKCFPLVVKAPCEGSSIGVHVLHDPEQWAAALEDAFSFGPQVLVEKFIEGREVTVGILGDRALPVVEIVAKNEFFDFEAKYQKGFTKYVVPAALPDFVRERLGQIALKAFQVLGCYGFARVDVRLDVQLNPYILEINTIPGFTETSLFPKAAKADGLNFYDVCLKLIEFAYGQKK